MTAFIRTALLSLAIGSAVVFGFVRLLHNEEQAARAELEALNADMQERLAAREAMLERLGRSRRLARIEITAQQRAAGGEVASTELLFIEVDGDDSEVARQKFTIPGDVLFVDAWTVQFAHEDVAAGHPLRGRTLVLLRRIYSDRMAPIDGFAIDTPGAVPPAYAGGDLGRYEQGLWRQFWEIATDADLAAAMGVRVAQGVAVYKAVKEGDRFRLVVDAAGGVTLTPLSELAVAPADG